MSRGGRWAGPACAADVAIWMTASMSSFVGRRPALVGGREDGGVVLTWGSTREWALEARRLTMVCDAEAVAVCDNEATLDEAEYAAWG